jgi:hypothetical protein
MRYRHTQDAATVDRQSRWGLIEAIALDAVENDVPISGGQSVLATKAALDAAGNELADDTVKALCVVAKFDAESTAGQRRTWRTYPWSSVLVVAKAGLSQEAAFGLLAGHRLPRREIEKRLVRRAGGAGSPEPSPAPLGEALHRWIARIDDVLTEGAELAARADTEDEPLDAHAQMALYFYERLIEKKFDAELRDLLEQEGIR